MQDTDYEKTGSTTDAVIDSTNEPQIDAIAEKKLLRRMDGFIMPILGALYLMCFLDRGNMGSANVATPSISQACNLTTEQYGAVVSIVYATYVVFEPVWANLLKIVSPRILLGGTTLCWASITLGTAWAGDYKHLIAIRLLLGVFEAALFPCVTVYIMMHYRREETGRRMSYIFSCAAVSGAVGGMIAGGLVKIETGKIVGWQYLFIVEGAISFILAPIAFFAIPTRMEKAWFLSAAQRDLAAQRYEINKRNFSHDEVFDIAQVRAALTDWTVYASGTIQFCADITLYGISTFMPQIIKAMGFTNVQANLLTVPVYFVGATSFIIVAFLSDKYQLRSPFIVGGLALNVIGFIILIAVESVGGRYFGLFVVAAGLYITPGLNCTWIGGNMGSHYKRATAVGMNQLIGNSSGAAIGSIFYKTLAPRYLQSMYISIGLTIFGLLLAGVLGIYYRRENARRDKLVEAGALDQPELGDKNPHFRYWL